MEYNIEYPTHRLILHQENKCIYTKVTCYVDGKVYNDMVNAIIMDDAKAFHFVYYERQLINGFLKSLVSYHNKEYKDNLPIFYCFDNELEYYQFCVDNDLLFEEQEWCKTAYICKEIKQVSYYLTNASILLIRTLYPEFINPSKDKLFKLIVPSHKEQKIEKPKELDPYATKASLYKCNPKDYQYFLVKNNIDRLYHFTSSNNRDSIRNNGICSIKYLGDHGISVHYASSYESRNIDKRKQTHNYVHLSYERKNPMLFIALKEGRLNDYIIYEVSTDVLFLKDTMFTHCNAAKTGAVFSTELSYMMEIPFNKFHNMPYDKDSCYKDFFMSEILVKDRILPSLILNLNV